VDGAEEVGWVLAAIKEAEAACKLSNNQWLLAAKLKTS
jgi:hypothetical protein